MKGNISLSRKVSYILILSGMFFVVLLTTVSTIFEYQDEKKHTRESIKQTTNSTLRPLAKSMWNFDQNNIDTIINSLSSLPNVVGITLLDDKENIIFTEKPSEKNIEDKLEFKVINNNNFLGILRVYTNYNSVYEKEKWLFLYHLFFNFFIVTLITFVFHSIFKRLVLQHIEELDDLLIRTDFTHVTDAPKILFNRMFPKTNDELKDLERRLNQIFRQIAEANRSKDAELEFHKTKAANAARMASLGEVTAGLSHEIKNLIFILENEAYILGKMIKKENQDREKILKEFDNFNKIVDRVTTISRGMLAMSRDESETKATAAAFWPIVQSAVELLEPRFEKYNIDFSLDFNPEELSEKLAIMKGSQVAQVIINLINNSLSAIEKLDDKWIRLNVYEDDTYHVISLTDSGSGIPEEVAEKIFNPFFTTRDMGKGTGLGLSLSKSIIENMNGKLELDRDCPNTRFLIKIQKAEQPQLKAA